MPCIICLRHRLPSDLTKFCRLFKLIYSPADSYRSPLTISTIDYAHSLTHSLLTSVPWPPSVSFFLFKHIFLALSLPIYRSTPHFHSIITLISLSSSPSFSFYLSHNHLYFSPFLLSTSPPVFPSLSLSPPAIYVTILNVSFSCPISPSIPILPPYIFLSFCLP